MLSWHAGINITPEGPQAANIAHFLHYYDTDRQQEQLYIFYQLHAKSRQDGEGRRIVMSRKFPFGFYTGSHLRFYILQYLIKRGILKQTLGESEWHALWAKIEPKLIGKPVIIKIERGSRGLYISEMYPWPEDRLDEAPVLDLDQFVVPESVTARLKRIEQERELFSKLKNPPQS